MRVAAQDPLVALGLLDPQTGKPFETEDWTGAEPTVDYRAGRDASYFADDDEPAYRQTPPPPPTPEAGVEGAAAPHDDRKAAEEARQWLISAGREIQVNGQTMYQNLISQRDAYNNPVWSEENAKHYVKGLMERDAAIAYLQAFQYSTQDVAVRVAAERVAREHRVDPSLLATEKTVEGMQARARTLKELPRQQRFEARRASGVDRREGGAPAGTALAQAYDTLTPQGKIRLGLIRGD